LVDIEKQLGQAVTNPATPIPGLDLFLDHVHFRFDGDYVVARTLLTHATNALDRAEPAWIPRGNPMLTRGECARRLGLTFWDEVQVTVAMVELTRKPPFLDQADHEQFQKAAEDRLAQEQQRLAKKPAGDFAKIYEYALKLAPEDWMLHHNYSLLLSAMGRLKEAAEQLGWVVDRLPDVATFRIAYGHLLARSGRLQEAREQLAEVLRRKPKSAAARTAMEWLARQNTRLEQPSTSR
jgi:tetratricopeptide (TPR) repeat protein